MKFVPLWLTAMFVAAAASPATADTLLRWKFKPNATYRVAVTQETDMRTSYGRTQIRVRSSMQMEMEWKVLSVDEDGAAKMSQSFTRLSVDIAAPGRELKFDTKSEDQPEEAAMAFADAALPLIGKPFKLTMSPRGEISDVSIPEEAAALVEGEDALQILKEIFSADGLAKVLQDAVLVMPKDAVGPSDEWKTKTSRKLPIGSAELETTYAFRGPEESNGRTLQKIELDSQLKIEPIPGKPVAALKKHERAGALFFDAAAGRMARGQITQTIETERRYREVFIRVNSVMKTTAAISEAK